MVTVELFSYIADILDCLLDVLCYVFTFHVVLYVCWVGCWPFYLCCLVGSQHAWGLVR